MATGTPATQSTICENQPDKSSEKPKGFEFWHTKLNSAKYVVAPMVDQSELAWRMLSRKYGAQLCYTPMLHASVFTRNQTYREESLTTCEEDRPLIVQFCANDPQTLLQAAKLAEKYCDAIDINLGCPQKIAKKGHYGAFLQDEWDLLYKMVDLCNRQLSVPVTCKIRVFENVEKTVKYAQMLEKAGCQLLTVHGRTREQKGPMTGLASWKHIKAVKENVSIPVFANGNIQYLEDVDRCVKETGVNGVMSAEGNLHNPALFNGINPPIWEVAEEYMKMVDAYPCPMSYIRGHLFKMFHHAIQIHADIREEVAKGKTVECFKMATQLMRERCLRDIERIKEDPSISYKPSLPHPYWICQPYVRPDPSELNTQSKKQKGENNSDSGSDKSKLKRPLGELSIEDSNLSKKKLKKKMRYPKKCFDVTWKIKYERCGLCANPKGQKCCYGLCRNCCRNKAFVERLDCIGHRFTFKSRPKPYKTEEGPEGPEVTAVAN
ncbi:tRNA-dihydrouridine16/17 17 synthase NADP+-like [Octopus vulgaris]|uniref:tRNA-dihydrouridine(16/17) synthase [NAD(P)(+)]-like n=1 Tax=Octopus vulgaris TaxID=6645 RepID=A0AA36BY03_OCTVU|nr:tRNA-dihydrouridine16/17 17 synthase NADP+-like [Octopus vulgaris]